MSLDSLVIPNTRPHCWCDQVATYLQPAMDEDEPTEYVCASHVNRDGYVRVPSLRPIVLTELRRRVMLVEAEYSWSPDGHVQWLRGEVTALRLVLMSPSASALPQECLLTLAVLLDSITGHLAGR